MERNIARQAKRFGQPLPDRIADSPELILGLQFYLDAFFDLDSERSHSTGITAIPWTKIREYADAYKLDEEQTEDLLFFVKRMDGENMKRLAEKQKKITAKSAPKKTPKSKKGR